MCKQPIRPGGADGEPAQRIAVLRRERNPCEMPLRRAFIWRAFVRHAFIRCATHLDSVFLQRQIRKRQNNFVSTTNFVFQLKLTCAARLPFSYAA